MGVRKVLVVCRNFWPENQRINDLCEDFDAAGIKVDVLCGQPSTPFGDFYKGYDNYKVKKEKWGNINIYRTFDVRRGQKNNVSLFLNYCVFPVAGRLKIRQLMKNGYDAVFMFQLSPILMTYPGLVLGRKMKIPKIIYAVDMWPFSLYSKLDIQSPVFQKFLYRMSMKHYSKADSLITISDKARKYLIDNLGITGETVYKVPLSPQKNYGMHIRNDNLMEKYAGSFNILIIGDASASLSVETIIGAAKLIRAAKIKNIRFIVLGVSELIKKLMRYADVNELHDYFHFEGSYKTIEIPQYTYIASAILSAIGIDSVNEYSVPIQVINYMAASLPLIMSMGSAVRELIKDADCGMSSEPDDVQALYDNIIKLYRMPANERQRLGINAGLYQEEHFNRGKNVRKIIDIINGKTLANDLEGSSTIKKIWDIEATE